jgi:uncharacterized tellurite resistance protein B-like protein
MKDNSSSDPLFERASDAPPVNDFYSLHPPSPELSVIVRSFASVLLGQAVADGEVYSAEMQRIEQILRKMFYLGAADIERLVREALNESAEIGSLAFENSLNALRERFLPHQRRRFQDALLEVAESDGSVDDRERCFFYYVSKRLGL